MKRKISFLLATILLLTTLLAIPAAQAEARASVFFDTYGVTVNKYAGGKIKFRFQVDGTEVSDQIGVASYVVQKRNSDGSYTSVTGALTGSIANDTMSYAFSRYYTGVPGEVYRVKVIFCCQNSHGYGTKEYNSVGVTAIN